MDSMYIHMVRLLELKLSFSFKHTNLVNKQFDEGRRKAGTEKTGYFLLALSNNLRALLKCLSKCYSIDTLG